MGERADDQGGPWRCGNQCSYSRGRAQGTHGTDVEASELLTWRDTWPPAES